MRVAAGRCRDSLSLTWVATCGGTLEQATRGLPAADYRQIGRRALVRIRANLHGLGLEQTSSVGENERRVSIGRKGKKRGIVTVCSQQKGEKKKKRKENIAGMKLAVRNQDDEGCDKGQSACACCQYRGWSAG